MHTCTDKHMRHQIINLCQSYWIQLLVYIKEKEKTQLILRLMKTK